MQHSLYYFGALANTQVAKTSAEQESKEVDLLEKEFKFGNDSATGVDFLDYDEEEELRRHEPFGSSSGSGGPIKSGPAARGASSRGRGGGYVPRTRATHNKR